MKVEKKLKKKKKENSDACIVDQQLSPSRSCKSQIDNVRWSLYRIAIRSYFRNGKPYTPILVSSSNTITDDYWCLGKYVITHGVIIMCRVFFKAALLNLRKKEEALKINTTRRYLKFQGLLKFLNHKFHRKVFSDPQRVTLARGHKYSLGGLGP